jgi:hypothetical protein
MDQEGLIQVVLLKKNKKLKDIILNLYGLRFSARRLILQGRIVLMLVMLCCFLITNGQLAVLPNRF